MKTSKTLLAGIAAAMTLSMTAYAEGNENKPKPDKEAMEKRRAANKAKMLERFDADNDGKLSESERKTARETIAKERKEIRAAVLKEFDKDNDGKLSESEREGVREWVKENYPDAIHIRPHHKRGKNGNKRGGPQRKGGKPGKKDRNPGGDQ